MNSSGTPSTARQAAITGAGVYAATGDLPIGLWGAVATRINSRRAVPGLSISAHGQEPAQPFYAPIQDLPEELAPASRMSIMATQALIHACGFLPEDRPGLRILVQTLLPASTPEYPEAGGPNQSELAEELKSAHPALSDAEVLFAPADTGSAFHLSACLEELHQGKWDAVLFGGVDTLIDRNIILGLAARGCCCTNLNPEGTLPGEGAAYLLLQKHDKAFPAMAVITGIGHGQEENHGKAADLPMRVMAAAIEQALGQGECPSVQTAVLHMGNDVPSALEWYQIKRRLWEKPQEPEGSNHKMEELLPQLSIGDTGAAALPLCLAIACARFEFDAYPVERILVCDAGRGPARGAVFLNKSIKE